MHATEVPNEHPVLEFVRDAENQLKKTWTSEKYASVRRNLIISANQFFDSSHAGEVHDALPETYEAFREVHSGDQSN